MAKINGLELKNVKEFKMHEDEQMYQASIYLEGKKIGEWKQNYTLEPDCIDISNEYDLKKLTDKIIELNNGKENPFCYELTNKEECSPWGGLKDYCLDLIFSHLIVLNDWEKAYKNVKEIYGPSTGIVIASDGSGIHEYIMPYENVVDKGTAIEIMQKENLKFFKNSKAKYMAFTSLEDFNLFDEVYLSDIRSDKHRVKNKQNDRQR